MPNILVLFSYGQCNLKCSYCNIVKDEKLKTIDKIISDSFDNYEKEYCERIKKWFPNELYAIELWGGETSLGLPRIYPLLKWIIKEYPTFNNFFFSTNFSYIKWVDNIIELLNFFSKYPNRTFNLKIQLSIDGPKYINDANRGTSTTNKCLDNIEKLSIILKEKGVPNNVCIQFQNKPTLDIEEIVTFNTKEKIIDYYKFFEDNLFSKLEDIANIEKIGIPMTIASPSFITKNHGIFFTTFIKLCDEIEKEITFKYYDYITPYKYEFLNNKNNAISNTLESSWCEFGVNSTALLPNNLYSRCINFYDVLEESSVKLLNENQYTSFIKESKEIYYNNNSNINFMIQAIKMLALSDQIDKKYLNYYNALEASNYLNFLLGSYCINDNLKVNNSAYISSNVYEYKLFLNGALDEMLKW